MSVVVPVKGSHRTIRRLTDSLLAQDYPGEVEIVLVGDYDDSTWEPITDQIEAGQITRIDCEVITLGRDANAKRNIGLSLAQHGVLALTDSDMVLSENWISTGVKYLKEGRSCVAGPMSSVQGDFWGHYVDRNMLGSKTPRMEHGYTLNRRTFGRTGFKPPITANFFFIRKMLEDVGGLDNDFVFTYEDYEWFRRVIDTGYEILCIPDLVAAHYHRQGFKELTREYMRGGQGCLEYIIRHPHCRFAHTRMANLAGVYIISAGTVSLLRRRPRSTAKAGLTGMVAIGALSAYRTRSKAAVVYPGITLILGMTFAAGMTRRLLQGWSLPTKSRVVSYRTSTEGENVDHHHNPVVSA